MRVRSRSRTRAPRRIVASGGLLLVLAQLALVAAPAALAAPALDVAPSSGVLGTSIAATATGFPEGPVTFRWDNGQLLGTVTADAGGTAALSFAIPATAATGSHYVRACASSKCPQGTIYADATVTVVPPPTPSPVPPTPTPSPTPVSTPVPTAVPTQVPTPTPPGQTPRPTPTLRPGQTPLPTPVPTLPNGSPAPASPGATGSFDASPFASIAPTELGSATPTGLVVPGGETTASPEPGDPAAGPTSDGGVPAVPIAIGAVGVVVLLSVFVTLRRRRPSPAPAGSSAGPSSNALPTSWDDPGSNPEPETQLVASIPVLPPPWPAADQAPRQRTMVVHVTPKDPTDPTDPTDSKAG